MKKFLAIILSILILVSAGFYTLTAINDLTDHAQNPTGTVVQEKNLSDTPDGIPFPPPDEG